MPNSRSFLVFSILFLCYSLGLAQKIETYSARDGIPAWEGIRSATAAEAATRLGEASLRSASPKREVPSRSQIWNTQPEQLYSPFVSQIFYEIGYELANSKDISPSKIEQAIVFLTAAMNLDSSASYIRPLLIELACRSTKVDYSEMVYYAIEDYVDKSADLEVVRCAIQFLLEQLNSREDREVLLKAMFKNLGEKNLVLRSELATLLGVLMAEKPDLNSAKFYLMQAYNNNRYNRLAFEKLAELIPEQISPVDYLEQKRLTLRENPLDIEATLAFAQYAERLELYEIAAGAYEYCADLFGYLYPSEPLPARIYLPMAISYYNTRQNQRCLQIAAEMRQKGRFDLLLEAIAGKAAMKIGDTEQANRIFQTVEEKAQQLLKQGPQVGATPLWALDDSSTLGINATQFAWFYCFVVPDEHKALDWANRAYSTEPNSPAAAALLAYSLMMNQQTEWAKPLINNLKRSQIADLTLAQIQLNQAQKDSAINTLMSAVAKDPGSFEAEHAKELLGQLGATYAQPFEPNAILTALEDSFGQTLVPTFNKPEEIISVRLNVRSNEFFYGSAIDGTVVITNNSREPLVISDDGLFRGNIRIDAEIGGDITKDIPNLVSRRIGTALLIEPGSSNLTSIRLVTGQLRQVLLAHPQASLEIKFTIYIDPVTTEQGEVANRLTYIEPTKLHIKRPGIELSGKYLINQFNSISTEQTGQKIKTAELFTGLLLEQQAMANRKPLYRYLYADWMPTMLKSALIHESGLLRNPADGEWVVKTRTMAGMLSLTLDHEITQAVAENLNNTNWPVRMMALYLLAKDADSEFAKVLDWAAKNDSNKLVRDMAVALGNSKPQIHRPVELMTPGEAESLLPIVK